MQTYIKAATVCIQINYRFRFIAILSWYKNKNTVLQSSINDCHNLREVNNAREQKNVFLKTIE